MRYIVVVAMLSACVAPGQTHCEGGGTCPSGTSCTDDGRCVSPEQLASCDGLADGEACSYLGVPDGACRAGACTPAGCGNFVIESARGETCDDGNSIPLDGCSADCTSNEECGNHVVDRSRGEQCDDGDAENLDGCSSTCIEEAPAWASITSGPPQPRVFHAMTYDSGRERVVMFGGNASPVMNDTWEWDGQRWIYMPIAIRPRSRFGHALAYDPVRRKVVLFGGRSSNEALDDTWEYDGTRWIEILASGSSPEPRWLHTMTYDARLGKVILYGGDHDSDRLDDTWAWDGAAWELIAGGGLARPSPSPRDSASMVYDPVADHTILFGGRDETGELADTWLFDAGGWHATSATGASARWDHELAFDAGRGIVVMSGGSVGNTPIANNAQELMQWSGSAWIAAPTPNASWPNLDGHATAYDVARGQLVAFAGGVTAGRTDDTWLWNAATGWKRITARMAPGPRTEAAMAWDSKRGRAVMFGGRNQSALADTWEWDGGQWTPFVVAGPPAGERYVIAYDAARGLTVLFGGGTAETWLWNGSTWSHAGPTTKPPARVGGALAYDPVAARVVLFGGSTPTNGTVLGDTWLWDGATWTEVTGPGPSARNEHAMAYDPRRQKIVLFGGGELFAPRADTWLWDGSSWTDATPNLSPQPRARQQLVFHAARGSILMVGGTPSADVYEWDGATWSRPPVVNSDLAQRVSPSLAYVPEQGIFMFGGLGEGNFILDTMVRFRWDSPSQSDVCAAAIELDGDGLAGCADPDCAEACTDCGDGTCNPMRETCALCPEDCGACPTVCGDGRCDANETCPGDC